MHGLPRTSKCVVPRRHCFWNPWAKQHYKETVYQVWDHKEQGVTGGWKPYTYTRIKGYGRCKRNILHLRWKLPDPPLASDKAANIPAQDGSVPASPSMLRHTWFTGTRLIINRITSHGPSNSPLLTPKSPLNKSFPSTRWIQKSSQLSEGIMSWGGRVYAWSSSGRRHSAKFRVLTFSHGLSREDLLSFIVNTPPPKEFRPGHRGQGFLPVPHSAAIIRQTSQTSFWNAEGVAPQKTPSPSNEFSETTKTRSIETSEGGQFSKHWLKVVEDVGKGNTLPVGWVLQCPPTYHMSLIVTTPSPTPDTPFFHSTRPCWAASPISIGLASVHKGLPGEVAAPPLARWNEPKSRPLIIPSVIFLSSKNPPAGRPLSGLSSVWSFCTPPLRSFSLHPLIPSPILCLSPCPSEVLCLFLSFFPRPTVRNFLVPGCLVWPRAGQSTPQPGRPLSPVTPVPPLFSDWWSMVDLLWSSPSSSGVAPRRLAPLQGELAGGDRPQRQRRELSLLEVGRRWTSALCSSGCIETWLVEDFVRPGSTWSLGLEGQTPSYCASIGPPTRPAPALLTFALCSCPISVSPSDVVLDELREDVDEVSLDFFNRFLSICGSFQRTLGSGSNPMPE